MNDVKPALTRRQIIWIIITAALVLGLWSLNLYLLESKEETDRGTFGDMFGAVNSLFSGLAFAGIIFTILLQRNELELQREELQETRNEFKDQNQTLKRQRFENTFFQLLTMYNDIVKSLDLRKLSDKSVVALGRDCFQNFYARLQSDITNPKGANLQETLRGYSVFYEKNQQDLGHYFRHLYHIVKFVDQSDVENKKTYTNFVRAQLSSYELVMLFYNCLHDNGNEKFKPLVQDYSLLKNMAVDLVFNQQHLSEYSDSAYGS